MKLFEQGAVGCRSPSCMHACHSLTLSTYIYIYLCEYDSDESPSIKIIHYCHNLKWGLF